MTFDDWKTAPEAAHREEAEPTRCDGCGRKFIEDELKTDEHGNVFCAACGQAAAETEKEEAT